MPQTILLLAPNKLTLKDIVQSRLAGRWGLHAVETDAVSEYQTHAEDFSWSITIVDRGEDQETAEELKEDPQVPRALKSSLSTKRFIWITFGDFEICRSIVQRMMSMDEEMYFDTGYNRCLTSREFLELIEQNPDYDWRSC